MDTALIAPAELATCQRAKADVIRSPTLRRRGLLGWLDLAAALGGEKSPPEDDVEVGVTRSPKGGTNFPGRTDGREARAVEASDTSEPPDNLAPASKPLSGSVLWRGPLSISFQRPSRASVTRSSWP